MTIDLLCSKFITVLWQSRIEFKWHVKPSDRDFSIVDQRHVYVHHRMSTSACLSVTHLSSFNLNDWIFAFWSHLKDTLLINADKSKTVEAVNWRVLSFHWMKRDRYNFCCHMCFVLWTNVMNYHSFENKFLFIRVQLLQTHLELFNEHFLLIMNTVYSMKLFCRSINVKLITVLNVECAPWHKRNGTDKNLNSSFSTWGKELISSLDVEASYP